MSISLCMITKNEENFLENCLNNVKDLADEIIVVDTGSKDKTKEIAKKFTQKIYDFKWADDFSKAKNEAIRHATKQWILVLDADEIIEKNDKEKIKSIIANNKDKELVGFAFEQRSYIKDPFPGCIKNDSDFEIVKQYPFYIKNSLVRLFKNNLGLEFKHRIHEIVEDSIEEKNLKYDKTGIVLHHFGSVKDAKNVEEKTRQYSMLILKQLEDNPNSERYNYYAARYYLSINELGNALKYFEKTASINPKYKLVFSEIAKIYLRKNDIDKAIEYFRKSLHASPEDPSPANNLAVLFMHKKRYSEAKDILEKQLKKHPDSKPLNINYNELLKEIEKNKKMFKAG